jgi:DNA-binding transcriptional LysR family regulator
MDRLRAFEVFAAVVARGSFARAAAALDTSPANVTRTIQDLEAHLGTRLLNRNSRRLSLTDGGAALHDRCRAILEEVADAEAQASAHAAQPRGRLRINAPLGFGIRQLAPLWPRFMARHPRVALDVALMDRVVDIVEEGYDLAIRIARTGPVSLVARKLATSRNLVCAAPAYLARHPAPAHPRDLGDHACLGYTHGVAAEDWPFTGPGGAACSVKVPWAMRTNSGETARAAALAGLGILWQPSFMLAEDIRRGALVPLLPDWRMPDIDILAVHASRRHVSPALRAMIDFLVEAFRGTPPWEVPAASIPGCSDSAPSA